MVIGSVHRRAHKIRRARVRPEIMLVCIFLMQDARDQYSVGPRDIPSQFRFNIQRADGRRNNNLAVRLLHMSANIIDVRRLLVRKIRNPDSS